MSTTRENVPHKRDPLGWFFRNFIGPIIGGVVTGLILGYESTIQRALLSIEVLQAIGLLIGFLGAAFTIWWFNRHPPQASSSGVIPAQEGDIFPQLMAFGVVALITFMGGFFLFPALASSLNPGQLTPGQLQTETFVSGSAVVMMTTMFAWVFSLLVYLLYERYS
jgi:hypothetical protein